MWTGARARAMHKIVGADEIGITIASIYSWDNLGTVQISQDYCVTDWISCKHRIIYKLYNIEKKTFSLLACPIFLMQLVTCTLYVYFV